MTAYGDYKLSRPKTLDPVAQLLIYYGITYFQYFMLYSVRPAGILKDSTIQLNAAVCLNT